VRTIRVLGIVSLLSLVLTSLFVSPNQIAVLGAPTALEDYAVSLISKPEPDQSATEERAPGLLVALNPDVVELETQMQSTTPATPLSAVLSRINAQSMRPLVPRVKKIAVARQMSNTSLAHTYRLELAPGADIAEAIKELNRNPAVRYAEPDYLARELATPNDPLYDAQWALARIEMPQAWDVETGSTDTVIAVIDAGLDIDHPDLQNQLWTNPGEIPGNGIDDDNNGYVDDIHGWNIVDDNSDLSDNTGHGTEVAGVIAAEANNSTGIAGVCWNCRLMVVKVVQSGGVANYSDIIAGIEYARNKGVEIINLSLGGYADSLTLQETVEAASETTVLVGGAGNDNKEIPFYPAAYDAVVAVAGTDAADQKVDTSNYGAWVDVSAPGAGIRTTFDGGTYGDASGTSMAVPFVSGLAGLLRSRHGDWSPTLVKAHLLQAVDAIDGANPSYTGMLGSGRVNAYTAVTTNPTPELTASGYTVDGQDKDPEPGTTFDLVLTLHNAWGPVGNLRGTLSTGDSYVTIEDASGTFGDIPSGDTAHNQLDTFRLSLHASTPYGRAIPMTLALSGDGYSSSLDFTLTVRSGIETLPGGTVIGSSTTWTADKTYRLAGNVVVGENVTLTIEPGTLIEAGTDMWLRIDGTLVASGTVELPITFKATDAVATTWAGLRFSSKSEPSVLDSDGQYVSGSFIQYARFYDATQAVGINGGSLAIIDSVFEGNSIGIQVENQGSATIIGCDIGASTSITDPMMYRGGYGVHAQDSRVSISNSRLTANSSAIQVQSTQLELTGNTITNNGTGVYAGSWSSTGIRAHENVIIELLYKICVMCENYVVAH